MKELISVAHMLMGAFGIMSAIWLLVELLNMNENNKKRINNATVLTTVFIWLTYILGIFFYVNYHSIGKEIIKAGEWAWVQKFIMEAKEHNFFLLLLCTYIPFVVFYGNLQKSTKMKKLAITITFLIVVVGLVQSGLGEMVSRTIRMSLMKGGDL